MNKKVKALEVSIISIVMVVLAFSGISHGMLNDSASTSNSQALSVSNRSVKVSYPFGMPTSQKILLNNLLKTDYYNTGRFIISNDFDRLQYKADLSATDWYISNYYLIPPQHRGLTKSNVSIILGMWEHDDKNAKKYIDSIEEYEMNQHLSTAYHINQQYVVEHHEGTLLSNETIAYHGQKAFLLRYRYSKDNETVVYTMFEHNGKLRLIDPTIRLNEFTIYWGWLGLIQGPSYNIYLDFYNYNNAVNFKNFVSLYTTMLSIAQFVMDAAAWAAILYLTGGTGSILLGVLFKIAHTISGALGTTAPWKIYGRFNTLFKNEWGTAQDFRLVFTANIWESGLLPEYGIWGRINPGNSLYQVFRSFQYLTSEESSVYAQSVYYALTNVFGTNQYNYINPPSNWENWIGDY